MKTIKEIKIIWKYLRNYKTRVYKTAVLAMFGSVFVAIIPYIYGRLVDTVSLEVFDTNFVFALLGVWFVINAFSSLLDKATFERRNSIGIDVSNDLTCKASAHVMSLPLKFHKERKVGEIFSRIDRASMYIARIIEDIVFLTLPQLFTVFVGILIMFFMEWRLGLCASILFFGYILITIYKTAPIVETQEKLNKVFEKAYGNLYDSFLNIATIKSCAVEDTQKQKTEKDFKENLGNVYKDFMGLWASLNLWQQFFFGTGFLAIFGFAIFSLNDGLISTGKLIMFLGYLGLMREPLRDIGRRWKVFKTGMPAIKRVEDLLGEKTENYKKHGKILDEVCGKIEFKNVSFGYEKGMTTLKGINFTSLPGEKIAIVGGSGEGKTTLVDLISLYLLPTRGKILLDGVNIRDLNLNFLRKIIAYVPQEIILFNDTIKNNICYGKPDANDDEVKEAARGARASRFIENFSKGYAQLVGERGVKLSGGQKQRLAIARALIRNPKILILDEATSALDVESEKMVQDALEKLIQGRTTFIIAHRLSTVQQADRILVLEKGRIVEQGTHKQLIKKKGVYFKFYSIQSKM